MPTEITTFGHVNKNGELKTYNKDIFLSSIKQMLSGASVQVTITKTEGEFSNQWRRYYFKIIVRELQKAFKSVGMLMSLKETDYYMRNLYLYQETYVEEKDLWDKKPHTLRKGETKVTPSMFKDYCMHCIRFSVKYLDWAIPYINEQENVFLESN